MQVKEVLWGVCHARSAFKSAYHACFELQEYMQPPSQKGQRRIGAALTVVVVLLLVVSGAAFNHFKRKQPSVHDCMNHNHEIIGGKSFFQNTNFSLQYDFVPHL
jgi:hypothetical protein